MNEADLKLNPIDTPFTVRDDEPVRRRIVADLEAVVRRVVPAVGEIVRPVAIALIGGFGRGEGGVLVRDGRPAPVNDYDFIVVVENSSALKKRSVRRVLSALSKELERQLGVAIDLDVRDAGDLARAPNTTAWYEAQSGHKIIWGDGGALAAMPEMRPEKIGAWDGGFLLFNRTGGLLIAKKMLLDGGPRDEPERTYFLVQLSKAAQAWGDCVLILQGRYDASYRRRMEIARAADFSAAPHGERARAEYASALEMKIRPRACEVPRDDLAAMFASTVEVHEDFMKWFEGKRLGAFGDWREYAGANLIKLDMPPQRSSCWKNFAKNVRMFGAPVGAKEMRRYAHSLVERLASAAPLLLFGRGDGDLALAARLLRLKGALAARPRENLSAVIARYLALWH